MSNKKSNLKSLKRLGLIRLFKNTNWKHNGKGTACYKGFGYGQYELKDRAKIMGIPEIDLVTKNHYEQWEGVEVKMIKGAFHTSIEISKELIDDNSYNPPSKILRIKNPSNNPFIASVCFPDLELIFTNIVTQNQVSKDLIFSQLDITTGKFDPYVKFNPRVFLYIDYVSDVAKNDLFSNKKRYNLK